MSGLMSNSAKCPSRCMARYDTRTRASSSASRSAAGRPQEHHTLVGPITLADDLPSLGVHPGTRHDERPHPGIIDHMLDDLWEGLTVGKACHSGRIRSPPEALQDPVDAVTRLFAKRRQIETGRSMH